MGKWPVDAALDGKPTGGLMEEPNGAPAPPGGTWRLAPEDCVRHLRIGDADVAIRGPLHPATGPRVPVPDEGFSPRFFAEHNIMPRFLRERGASACLAAIEAKDDAFFIPVWFEAGFRFSPVFSHAVHGQHRIGIMTFPRPRRATEAYVGVVVGRVDDPTALRYFLWEESLSVAGEKGTMIGEWDGSTHRNHGAGPRMSGDLEADLVELTRRIVALLA